jgi:Pyruvate/2-oxoacid:ferredoxin oxidoreductase gamma subunit
VAPFPASLDLARFLERDFETSFWNGQGSFRIQSKDFVSALDKDPRVTVGALRQQLRDAGKPLVVPLGLDFGIAGSDPIRLGMKNGGGGTGDVAFSAHAEAHARVFIVLGADALPTLRNDHSVDFATMLRDHTVIGGQDAVIVVTAGGEAGAEFASTVLNRPGVNVGVSFKAGGTVDWAVCRPALDGDAVIDALRRTLAAARLPQSDPGDVMAVNGSVALGRNEILYTSFTGFLSLAGEATFGYDASGTITYAVGKLDLATTLAVKAQAKVNVGFSMAGAFRILVLPGTESGWARVVVEKNRTSTFDVGVGVTVDARLATAGLPDTTDAPLALIESILGFRTPQVAQQVLNLAALPPDALKQKADGAIKAFVATWTGRSFEKLADGELGDAMNKIAAAAHAITHADNRAIALYEQYVVANLQGPLKDLASVVSRPSLQAQREGLVEKFGDEKVRFLVGLLVDRGFGQVVTSYEQGGSNLKEAVEKLTHFVDADADQGIRTFIETRTKTLGLRPLFDELRQIDTVDKLKARSAAAVGGLVERLTGLALDKLFASPEVNAIIKDVNTVAKTFDEVLRKINDVVTRAMNARGRLEMSSAYQHVREGDKLVDVQIHVDQADAALRAKAHEIYRQATRGRFEEVLKDENAPLITVSAAAFTEALTRVGTIKVNVYGWNYKEVNTLLSTLDANVKESPTGMVTVYNVGARGESTRVSSNTVTLGYVFQVTGQVNGAFQADDRLRKQTVDAYNALTRMQSELDYAINDPLTSLDELRSYLGIGQQLRVLGPGQTARLIGSVQELRRPADGGPAAMDEKAFRRVGVTYTVGFAGEALAHALTADLTGTTIGWWGDKAGGRRRPVEVKARDHQMALQSIYIDRLIASYLVGRQPNKSDYAVPAMYAAGIHRDLLDNPNAVRANDWRALTVTGPDGTPLPVAIPPTAVEWARRHYFVNVALAKFLDGFRASLKTSTQQPIGNLEAFLTDLVKNLMDAGKGEQASLPFMMLDELVRRTSGASPDARRALLEITLYDEQGKPANYIPVVA